MMNIIVRSILLLSASVLLFACQKSELDQTSPSEATGTGFISVADMKITLSDDIQRGVPFTATLDFRTVGQVEYILWSMKGLPDEEFNLISGQGTRVITARFDHAGYRNLEAAVKIVGDRNIYRNTVMAGYDTPGHIEGDAGVFSTNFKWRFAMNNNINNDAQPNYPRYNYTRFEITEPMLVTIDNLWSEIPGTSFTLYRLLDPQGYDFVWVADSEFAINVIPNPGWDMWVKDYYRYTGAVAYMQGYCQVALMPGLYEISARGFKVSNAGFVNGVMMTTIQGELLKP